ncbi:MAG: flagellar motor switch protein FliG [Gemmatimonadaceae bacterium]|nr:flagellar motor switch protein FliG [Gemmatimonadaceae bacterium]
MRALPSGNPSLTGRQKAAVLCLALGAENAAKVTQRLSAEEAEVISLEIARMDRVDPEVAKNTLMEWIDLALASEAVSTGGVEYARLMLEKAYNTQKAQAILKRITSHLADTAGLQRLRHADPKQIAGMFRSEHPQTTALVIAHLATPQAAAVLKELDPIVAADVALRMARMEKVSPEMLELIERSLGSDSDLDFQRGMSSAGGPASVASILNLLQGALEKSILEKVAEQDFQLSEQIKNLMFVFEDLRGLDDRALQRLLRDVDTKTLATALKGASAELRQRITGQMSQRAAQALVEEMEMLGPTRMKDAEAAQATIVAQARALEEAGEIVLTGGGDDVVLG